LLALDRRRARRGRRRTALVSFVFVVGHVRDMHVFLLGCFNSTEPRELAQAHEHKRPSDVVGRLRIFLARASASFV
jgi:hypothetical protein